MSDDKELIALLNYVKTTRAESKKVRRKYKQRASKLEVHRTRIILLHKAGASLRDIQDILSNHIKPRIVVSRTTIKNFIDKSDMEMKLENEDLFV